MKPSGNTRALVARLWSHVHRRRRVEFLGVLVLIVASALAEIVSLGTVIPFLTALSDPAGVLKHSLLSPWLTWMGVYDTRELMLPLATSFCVMAGLSAAIRYALVWAQVRLGARVGNDIGEDCFSRTLYQPYLVHVRRNSSEVVAALMSKTDTVVNFVLVPALMLVGCAITGVAIFAFMFWSSPFLTTGATALLAGAYGGVVAAHRKRLIEDSRRVTEAQTELVQVVQEGLGGIRDVLVGGLQGYFVSKYRDASRTLRHAVGTIAIFSNAPRYFVEALALIVGGLVVFHVAGEPGGLDAALPRLGALALAVQRLMPLAQQAYYSVTAIRGSHESLTDVLALLEQPLPSEPRTAVQHLAFELAIELQDVSFRYAADAPFVIKGVRCAIAKGSRVGIVGETGSGKSTLLDLLMGLLPPTEGVIKVDGVALGTSNVRAWQKRIAHVPQHVFLADASVAENIAFGAASGEMDQGRVERAARLAQLGDTILEWQDGFATRVGERGVQLSGGQRQRLGIARALYVDADVLVLDEATSALDDETEDALVGCLEGLGPSYTVVTVAHRKRSLRGCDVVLVVRRDGTVQRLEPESLRDAEA